MCLLGPSICHLAFQAQDKIHFLFRESIICLFIFKLEIIISMSRVWEKELPGHQPPAMVSKSFQPLFLFLLGLLPGPSSPIDLADGGTYVQYPALEGRSQGIKVGTLTPHSL